MLLILSLGHTPLPKADYHNIRHHDGPGQSCRYHDHLLRWHPDAGQADDVAVLHWHWFLPTPGAPGATPSGEQPAVGAAAPDWSGLCWDDGPHFAPAPSARFLGRPDLGPPSPALPPGADPAASLARDGPTPAHTFGATFAPRIPLATLLRRLTC